MAYYEIKGVGVVWININRNWAWMFISTKPRSMSQVSYIYHYMDCYTTSTYTCMYQYIITCYA